MSSLCWPLHNSGRFKEVLQDLSCSCVLLWGCETPAGGWTASLALLLGPSFSFACPAPCHNSGPSRFGPPPPQTLGTSVPAVTTAPTDSPPCSLVCGQVPPG